MSKTNLVVIQTLQGHNGEIESITKLDNISFASGSSDKSIIVWSSE